jgi:hypothetical protein
MSRKTAIRRIVSQNDAGWVSRNSVTFRDFHPAFIPRPPTIRRVHASPPIRSDLVIRPNQYAEKRPDIFRDAEVVGSSPTVPTQKPQVRPLSGAACWFGPPVPSRVHRASQARCTSDRPIRAPTGGQPHGRIVDTRGRHAITAQMGMSQHFGAQGHELSQPYRSASALPIEARWSRTP